MKTIILFLSLNILVACQNVAKDTAGQISSGSISGPSVLVEGNQSLTVSWNVVPGQSYTVKYRPASGGNYTEAGSSVTPPFTVTGLINNIDYEIRIEDQSKKVASARGTPRVQDFDITLSNTSVSIADALDHVISFTSDVDLGTDSTCTTSSAKGVAVSVACQCTNFSCDFSVKKVADFVGELHLNYSVDMGGVLSRVGTLSGTVTDAGGTLSAQLLTSVSTMEEQSFTATLPYTGPAGVLASSCSVSALNHLNVTSPCACNGSGVCTVGLAPTANYNGTATFKFSVTAGAITSNLANAQITVTSVDDMPVTSAQSASLSKNSRDFFLLPYSDVENDRASSCAISGASNLTVTTPCACSSGVCSVEVEGTSNFTGAASFSYSVTANGSTSNLSLYSIAITNVNTPPTVVNGTSTLIARASKVISLPYADADADQADSCSVSALVNISVKTPCACSGGTCQIEVTGNQGKLGAGSFMFTVRANGSRSNTARMDLTLSCPAGYVPVNTATGPSGSIASTLGAGPFCVMAFEAKCSGTTCSDTVAAPPSATARAVSTSTGLPWRYITAINASIACNNIGTNYDLISNAEWMTLARVIELEPTSWYSGTVGTGRLFRGNVTATMLPVSDQNNPYSDTTITWATGTTTEKEQKRFFVLDNGHKVWDLVGNAEEWIDWKIGQAGIQFVTPAKKAYQSSVPEPWPSAEFSQLDVLSDEMPAESFLPYGSGYTKVTNYIGNYSPGTSTTGGVPIRGGRSGSSGLYFLGLSYLNTTNYSYTTFRCVYRY